MKVSRIKQTIIRPFALLLSILLLGACTGKASSETLQSDSTPAAPSSAVQESTAVTESILETPETAAPEEEVLFVYAEDDGALSFIGGHFYDETIENEDDALQAVLSVLEELGGDENTVLIPTELRTNEEGTRVYTFRQFEGETAVYGAAVKLVADPDGKAAALVSSIVPGIRAERLDAWRITAEEAEDIVLKNFEGEDIRLEKDATMSILLPYEDDSSRFYYAWIVYTNNIYDDYHTAYLAHYVDAEGEYLYYLPVAEPDNADALSGEGAAMAFYGLEKGVWSGTVRLHTGREKHITVPTLLDPATGNEYLGDLERMIICADFTEFFDDDNIAMRKKENGRWEDNELLTYETYIRVYDEYAEAGWTGPDGDASPTLLLMDWVDDDGDPVPNACYAGRQHGFQVFQFNRVQPYGECTDVLAHEFTHCVTSTLMTTNLYINEYGALNEAFSDICGNILEDIEGDTEDTSWLIGENGTAPVRSMSNPNAFGQPGFVWDKYYVPPVSQPMTDNDNGGVHINSSLLNKVAWRLKESGMPSEDQLYYWMNASMVMTPRSDFAQMNELLPWLMEYMGYEEYLNTLELALLEVGFDNLSFCDEPPAGCGAVRFELPCKEQEDGVDITVTVHNTELSESFITWPEAGTDRVIAVVPEGRFIVSIDFFNAEEETLVSAVYSSGGWVLMDKEDPDGEPLEDGEIEVISVAEGDVVRLEQDSLKTLMEALNL